jgi:FkbM family methyltransferase
MLFNKFIFDVGAFDGADGLMLALKNKEHLIFAFEANPQQCSIIKNNKSILEKRIGRKILNYKLFNLAISNKTGFSYFFISNNPTVSSLKKIRKNFSKYWKGYDDHFKIKKIIKVKITTLKIICLKYKVKKISYLHSDTQGNDLNVLKGMGEFIKFLQQGIVECAVKKDRSIYLKNHTLKDVLKFFKKNYFKVTKISRIQEDLNNEVNVYFRNIVDINNFEKINVVYNCRYLSRVFQKRTYLKDDIKDFFLRIYNKYFLSG